MSSILFNKNDMQIHYDNWKLMHNFLIDNVYKKEITVDVVKKILSQFHSCCMKSTNEICNPMMAINVNSKGHSTGDKCKECPVRFSCISGNDCTTHIIYCNLSKLCLNIIKKNKLEITDISLINNYIDDLINLEVSDFGKIIIEKDRLYI